MNVFEVYKNPEPPEIQKYVLSLDPYEAAQLTLELGYIEAENIPWIQKLYKVLKDRKIKEI